MKSTFFTAALVGLVAADSYKATPQNLGGQKIVLEAESGQLTGTFVNTQIPGFSGSGYVDGFDTEGDKVTLHMTAPAATSYYVDITYSCQTSDKKTKIVANGGTPVEVDLPYSKAFKTVAGGQVAFKAGDNTIEIQNDWGWYLLDKITLTPAAQRDPHALQTTPCTKGADTGAKTLLKYLGSIYGKHILSGQQTQKSADQITNMVGKSPALLGIDMMEYTKGRIAKGSKPVDTDIGLAHAKKNGIVTSVWHWNAPSHLLDNNDHPWYSGFYTSASTFDIAAALADPNGADYKGLMDDIDTIAVQLQRFQDAGVPIMWRPLHEADGGWFWWGAKGPAPAKQLYRIMHDRLTNQHKLTNLVWVWNSANPDWYPGDDVVDIVSVDTYNKGDHSANANAYSNLVALTGDKKIVAAGEVGSLMQPDQLRSFRADWVYFLLWSDEFITNPDWNSPDTLKAIYNSDYVLTLDEIQGWKNQGY